MRADGGHLPNTATGHRTSGACDDAAMHIGLIGGIGPAATIVYYERLTRRVRGEGGRLELTIVQADIDELIANANADRREEQARAYLRLIERLAAAGADIAAITSLGGHFCFPETAAISPLPLVSAVAPLDDHFAGRGLRRVGLLGTEVVMRTRLYGQLARTEAVAPEGDLAALGRLYQAIAVSGACTDEQQATLVEAGRRMVEDQGAEAVVLAGTDLGLAFDGADPGYPVIDALDVHVALLADLALGRASLDVATPAAKKDEARPSRHLPTLRGDRVVLRPGRPEDAEALRAVYDAPEVARWWPNATDDDIATMTANSDPTLDVWIVEVDGRVVGLIQAYEESDPMYRHAGIDIVLHPDAHGQGLGQEAVRRLARHLFDERGHHRLVIDPNAANTRAIHVYEKVGFRRVGVLRQYEYHASQGGWTDGLLMEMLRDDVAD